MYGLCCDVFGLFGVNCCWLWCFVKEYVCFGVYVIEMYEVLLCI